MQKSKMGGNHAKNEIISKTDKNYEKERNKLKKHINDD